MTSRGCVLPQFEGTFPAAAYLYHRVVCRLFCVVAGCTSKKRIKMKKRQIKFISEFLIPSLNDGRFQSRLRWINKESKTFQISWCHKGGPKWTEREAEVFVEWDKHKGHYHPEDKEYYTKSKQRFRALLYKLRNDGHLIRRKSDDKFIKVYSIGEVTKKKKSTNSNENSECMYSDRDEEDYNEPNSYCANICEKRFISNNCMINILEDHAYSSATGFLRVLQTDNVHKYNFDRETLFPTKYSSDQFYSDIKYSIPMQEEKILVKSDNNLNSGYLKRNIDNLSLKSNEDAINTSANNLDLELFDNCFFNFDISNDDINDSFKRFDYGIMELFPETFE